MNWDYIMKMHNSLSFKITAMINLSIVIMAAVLLIISIKMASKALIETRFEGFSNMLSSYSSLFDTWINDQKMLIDTYSLHPDVYNLIGNKTEENMNTAYNSITKYVNNNQYIIDMGICDANGICIIDSSMSDGLIGKNILSIHPEAAQYMKSNNNQITFSKRITKSIAKGVWAIFACTGIKDANNNLIGYLYVMYDWTKVNTLYFSNIELSDDINIFAIDEDLTIIIHSNIERLGMKTSDNYRANFEQGSGIDNYISGADTGSQKRVSIFRKLTSSPWLLIISMVESQIYAQSRLLGIVIFIIGAISVILISIFVFIFIRKMMDRLTFISIEAKDIENGILSYHSNKIKFANDELGALSNSFNAMRVKLSEIITKVKDELEDIKDLTENLVDGNNNLSRRTEEQASSLQETASSMEEMASTIKSSTDNAIVGNSMMIESKTSIEKAGSIILETTNNIGEVNEASEKIKNITKIIEDIAFQTNILALNASVEAARAGDQGKGFAVVASEVRNLAQNTQSSIKNITDLVNNTYESIIKATNSASESQNIFNELKEKIDETSKIMQEIRETAVEQQAGVDQVNIAIAKIDDATNQNAVLVENSNRASNEVLEKIKLLENTISFFKL